MKILALIPARGGSKGILRKNVRPIAGKPLIVWTIEAALSSTVLDTIVVSTDDEEIAEIARKSGAEVPFLRPPNLAKDDTPGVDPVLHALAQLPGFDAVIDLPPTSPLRIAADIDNCVALAHNLNVPSVVSVCAPDKHPYWTYTFGSEQRLQPLINQPLVTRRQDLPPVYALNGALYYAHTDWLLSHRTFITAETVGYVMPKERSLDIDTVLDLQIADSLLQKLL